MIESQRKLNLVTQTFEQVIEKDKGFGSLLKRIKEAYDDYLNDLTKKMNNESVIESVRTEKELKTLKDEKVKLTR